MNRIKKHIDNLGLKSKLLVGFYIALLTILLISSLTIYFFIKPQIEQGVESELVNVTSTIKNMVKTLADVSIKNRLRASAEGNREIIEKYYAQVQSGKLSKAKAQKLILDILKTQSIGTTGYLYVIDSEGNIVLHPRKDLNATNVSEYGFIQKQITSREGYIEYEWKNPEDHVPREKALYMTYFEPWDWIISASSYRNEFGQLIDFNDIKDNLSSLKFLKSGYTFVIDKNGNVIFHPYLEGNGNEITDSNGEPLLVKMAYLKNGKLYYNWRDQFSEEIKEKMVIFYQIPELGWVVGSSVYMDEVHEKVFMAQKLIVGVAIFLMLILFPVAVYLASSVTSPIKELMKKFSKAEFGDLSVRAEIERNDELGQLFGYFNNFMRRLEKYTRKLQDEIAERKDAEMKLKYQAQLLRNVNDAVISSDHNFYITSWNDAAERLYGYKAVEALGQRIEDVVRAELSIEERKHIRTSVLEKDQWRGEAEHITKDGHRVYVDWSISSIRDAEGNFIGSVAINRDITSRKEFELELEAAKLQAEKSDRLKSEFLAQMSHEIRTPINSILNFTTLIRQECRGIETEDLKISFNIIESASKRVIRTIDLILNMSELQTGTYEYRSRWFDLFEDSLKSLQSEFKNIADEKKIKLSLVKQTDNSILQADEYSVNQIFQNLIDNAVKYTREGEVEIVLSRDQNNKMCVEIRDTGIGISEEFLPKLFEAFSQEEQGYSRKFEGNGLGLALVKKYCELNNAVIDVESNKGKGTTFTVTFDK